MLIILLIAAMLIIVGYIIYKLAGDKINWAIVKGLKNPRHKG